MLRGGVVVVHEWHESNHLSMAPKLSLSSTSGDVGLLSSTSDTDREQPEIFLLNKRNICGCPLTRLSNASLWMLDFSGERHDQPDHEQEDAKDDTGDRCFLTTKS